MFWVDGRRVPEGLNLVQKQCREKIAKDMLGNLAENSTFIKLVTRHGFLK